jgi:hypothetical protein
MAEKQFAAEANGKQAVTFLATYTGDRFLVCGDTRLGAMVRQLVKCRFSLRGGLIRAIC